ncbi:MAG: glutamate-5-semialdehyde dehydrogenase [Elusimicrobia bacterium]|nr:glutamate-5-semialdehyde dehydrogenase [Elusimicrobiota bacterium]
MAREAKEASRFLATCPTSRKNMALREMAKALRRRSKAILTANGKEVAAAKISGRTAAFVDRLTLNEGRLEQVAKALEHVARLPDPVGETTEFARRPNGLHIRKMRVPLGVVAIIYESRPGVTADAAGLCIKSGNAAVLRGGKEAVRTNHLIAEALREGIRAAGLPLGAVGFVNDPDRAAVRRLLQLDSLIDLVIPRGGPDLTVAVRRESMIPVLAHDKGLCHTYVDARADLKMAEEIAFNAKASRPGVCNAMETLIVHQAVAKKFLPSMARRFAAAGVELRGCPDTRRILPFIKKATDADWDTEYLDLILSVKIVRSFDEAVSHIVRHGSGLAEAIVTADRRSAERFLRCVDAGAVYWNASTRFTDGGEFGLGAEMGISTQKLHARGPVGLAGLTCEKYVVSGRGQTR